MVLTNFVTALQVLLPVLFVLGLGFWAGRAKQFDSDQVAGLNALVLNYALPSLLFVSIVHAPRALLFSERPFVLALVVDGLGLFVVAALVSVFLLRHTVSAAAIQSGCVTNANVGYIGIPVLAPLFGQSSLFSVAIAALVLNITIVPCMVTMIAYDRQSSLGGGGVRGLGAMIGRSLADSFSQPYVWAPLLAMFLVLLDLRVPKEIQTMLDLIGSATTGVALFVAGTILAAFRIAITFETIGNTLVKTAVQPAIMALLALMLGITHPPRSEAVVIYALSTAALCPMLAVRYKVYEAEAASTFLLTTLAMVVVVPLAITLTQ
jgi:predicted permease